MPVIPVEMSNPLSPSSADSLNRARSPGSNLACDPLKETTVPLPASPAPSLKGHDMETTSTLLLDGPPSSPFQSEVLTDANQERTGYVSNMSRTCRSPTKTFSILEDDHLPEELYSPSPSPAESQRAPVKPHASLKMADDDTSNQTPEQPDLEPAQPPSLPLREPDHSTEVPKAPSKTLHGDETLSRIRERSYIEHVQSRPTSRDGPPSRDLPSSRDRPHAVSGRTDDDDEYDARSMMSDDTCFSTFSAVPNADMTLFARLGDRTAENTQRSPTRQTFHTPRTSRKQRERSSRSPSPTPRGQQRRDGDTTTLLLDFTQPCETPGRSGRHSPSKRGASPTKCATESNLLSYIHNQRVPSPSKGAVGTPAGRKNLMTLLDFDLPPQPTPRSLPTITIRELESLKSQYLSEISSLKASLSGREAEVESLKKAVNDAERRVGQAQEEVREERSAREHAEQEKQGWEKKGLEVEGVLQGVREEFEYSEREKEELLRKLDESGRLREEAEAKLAEANTRANVAKSEPSADTRGSELSEDEVARRVNERLDEKMENLARELHSVYKKKHEAKVATLKKTYETRAEKRCQDLNRQIQDLQKHNDELQLGRDATFSAPVLEHQSGEAQSAHLEQEARLAALTQELTTLQQSHADVTADLERERVEKGELVAAVDEMLALQSDSSSSSSAGMPPGNIQPLDDLQRTISRPPSGLRGPGFGALKPTGGAAAGAAKSRMMSNIQRMQ